MIVSYKFRLKDRRAAKRLSAHSRAVNVVWNYCCEIQREAERRRAMGRSVRWPSAFDLIKLCTGAAADLGLHSDTVQTACRQFVASRERHSRRPHFRASRGARRSLGWVPLIARAAKLEEDAITYLKKRFRFWKSRDLDGTFLAGSFVEDARGRWYVVLQCEVPDTLAAGRGEIGIDLGLKSLATCSDGTSIPALQHYRQCERALATAQRSRNKRRVRAISAKITNARSHQLHVASTKLARENCLIVVGNVNAAGLAKTKMAKSVLDAGWSAFRHMLRYKAARRQAVYVEADERWTSATCSECGALSGPKGIAGLRIRHWECHDCGVSHDRDVNAARNILRVGRERPPLVAEIRAA